jgi:hypothetical protein
LTLLGSSDWNGEGGVPSLEGEGPQSESHHLAIVLSSGLGMEGVMPRIVTFMGCAIAIALTVACSVDPSDERPGLGLAGEVHRQAVEDWSFTEDADEIFIETVTSYWIPHSVTVWCVTVGNEFYVAADDADKKSWVANVARDPNVRLKIKDRVYEQKLVPVTDATTIAAIDNGFVRKYDYEEEDEAAYEGMTFGYWRVVERD